MAFSNKKAEGSEDPDALWDELYARLRRWVASRLWGRPAEDLEEVVQDTLIAIWEQWDHYDPRRASVFTWARTIANYKCADLLRTTRGRPGSHDLPPLSLDQLLAVGGEPVADPQGSGEEAALRRASQNEEAQRFVDALKRLTTERYNAIIERYDPLIKAGHYAIVATLGHQVPPKELVPWHEVARCLGISVSAATKNGQRGLRDLQQDWDALARRDAQRAQEKEE